MSSKEVPIAHLEQAKELYECRDLARRVLKGNYLSTMRNMEASIRSVSAVKECTLLEAVALMSKVGGDGSFSTLLLAAYVEIVEPTPIN